MKKIRITSVPKKMQQGGGYNPYSTEAITHPVTPDERLAWNKYQGNVASQPGAGVRDYNHNEQFQREMAQKSGWDYSRNAAIQADMRSNPNGVSGIQGGDTWGGKPGWAGNRELQKFYNPQQPQVQPQAANHSPNVNYDYVHLDKHGNRYQEDAGHTNTGSIAMSQKELNNWHNSAYKNMPEYNGSSNFNQPSLPTGTQQDQQSGYATNTPAPVQRTTPTDKSNWTTDNPEGQAAYSIDAVRGGGNDEYSRFGGLKRKIRITGTPEFKSGGYTDKNASRGYGMQQPGGGYNLDRSWGTPAGQQGVTAQVNPYGTTGKLLPKSNNPDIVVEKKEQILGDFDQDGKQELMGVNAGTHESGHDQGVNIPNSSFVFSDTKALRIKDPNILKIFNLKPKRGGYTPAEIAKKYNVNEYKKVVDNPNSDESSKKTVQLMIDNYMAKLNKLSEIQEGMKKQLGMEHHDPNQQQGHPLQGMRYGGVPRAQFGNTGNTITSDLPPIGGNEQPISFIQPPAYTQPTSKLKGYSTDQANAIIKKYGQGKDNIPYNDEVAAGQGYNFQYGHNTEGLQKWIHEENPNYKVGNNLYGIRTLSPPSDNPPVMNPWGSTYNPPAVPSQQPPASDFIPFAGPTQTQRPTLGPPKPEDDKATGKTPPKENVINYPRPAMFDPYNSAMWNLAKQQVGLNKYQPFIPAGQVSLINPLYKESTRAIAANAETARSLGEMQAMTGQGPASRANIAALQGEAMKANANVIGQDYNDNIGIYDNAVTHNQAALNKFFSDEQSRGYELSKAGQMSKDAYQRQMNQIGANQQQLENKHYQGAQMRDWMNRTNNSSPWDFDQNGWAKYNPQKEATMKDLTSGGNGMSETESLVEKQIKGGVPPAEAWKNALSHHAATHYTQTTKPGQFGSTNKMSYYGDPQEQQRQDYWNTMSQPTTKYGGKVDKKKALSKFLKKA